MPAHNASKLQGSYWSWSCLCCFQQGPGLSLSTFASLCHLFLLLAAVTLKAWASVTQPAGVLERNLQCQMWTRSSFVTPGRLGPLKSAVAVGMRLQFPASPMTHPREYLRYYIYMVTYTHTLCFECVCWWWAVTPDDLLKSCLVQPDLFYESVNLGD